VAQDLARDAEEAALAAEFIGKTADGWRRRALAAEAKIVALERDRATVIARLSELTRILRPDVQREESGHCGCCYRARRVLTAQGAEVVQLRAVELIGSNGSRTHRPGRK
jgi:hypothetical protein